MKKTLMAAALLAAVNASAADVYQKGYVRSDGTYVQPHHQTAPNHTTYDNYSTRGNVNPYTGQAGTRNPEPNYHNYQVPTYQHPQPTHQMPAYQQPVWQPQPAYQQRW